MTFSEYTVDDIQREARSLVKRHAKEVGVQAKRKAPLWLLAVSNHGAQLRVSWYSIDGRCFMTSAAL